MDRLIAVGRGSREVLKQKFGASLSTISNALNFKRDNQRAAEIRCTAVNNLSGMYIEL